jgi:hypothetical protein
MTDDIVRVMLCFRARHTYVRITSAPKQLERTQLANKHKEHADSGQDVRVANIAVVGQLEWLCGQAQALEK